MVLTAQDMEREGARKVKEALQLSIAVKVITKFAHPSHEPPPNQIMVGIGGYDYLVTVEFQDPR